MLPNFLHMTCIFKLKLTILKNGVIKETNKINKPKNRPWLRAYDFFFLNFFLISFKRFFVFLLSFFISFKLFKISFKLHLFFLNFFWTSFISFKLFSFLLSLFLFLLSFIYFFWTSFISLKLFISFKLHLFLFSFI